MADKSAIEWTDASWNPLRARNASTGKVGWFCTHVSEGCRNCYAESFNRRLGTGGDYKPQALKAGQIELFLDPAMLTQPLRWKKPRMIFVCSMTDLFADFVTDDQLDQIFAVMAVSTRHTYQVLTKRPERMRVYLTDPAWAGRVAAQILKFPNAWGDYVPSTLVGPLPNVWLGVSVEDQTRADERIPILLDTPATVRWISAEPLLGPVDIGRWTATARVTCKACQREFDLHRAHPCQHEEEGAWTLACPACGDCRCTGGWSDPEERRRPMGPPSDWPEREVGRFTRVHPTIELHSALDWVVAGGESGPGARPMHPDWARQLRDQCAAAGVPFLFKQWGEWAAVGKERSEAGLTRKGKIAWPDPDNTARGARIPMGRVGKKAAGRLLDGVLHDGFPEARS